MARQVQGQSVAAAGARQTERSYAAVARSAVPCGPLQSERAGQCVRAVANSSTQHCVQADAPDLTVRYSSALLVGPLALAVRAANSAGPPAEVHDIHSENEGVRWEDYEEIEEATVGELDPQVTDPKRILNRMRGITTAIQRRNVRRERA